MGPVSRMVEASNGRRGVEGDRTGLGGGKAVASGACQGSVQALHGSAVLVAGNYTVKAVQTQVVLQGPAGRVIWLGVDPRRRGWQPQVGCRVVDCKGGWQEMVIGWQG